jgi:hypothetical protein
MFLMSNNINNGLDSISVLQMLFSEHNEYILLLGTIVLIDAVTALPLAKLREENKAAKFAFIQFTSIGVNIGLNILFLLVFFRCEIFFVCRNRKIVIYYFFGIH